ncbi:MAG TPA: ABC transporter permease [Vicinamibacterales bacterium]|nr:ABC transporter permease [Vicinamibacterales bacterium]
MIAFTQRLGELAVRLAPEPLRSQLASDGLATLADAIDDARRRGHGDATRRAIGEIASLCLAAARARFGRQARITAGPPPHQRRRLRSPLRGEMMIAKLRHDLRFAARSLRASPGYTLLVMITLAVGIGVNTTVFSVLDSILFRPVPYADGERLASMWAQLKQGKQTMAVGGLFNPALIGEWRKQTDLYERVEAHEPRSFVFEGDTGPEIVAGATVSVGLFPMLGVRPAIGRWFIEGDGRDGSERLAIVSGTFWRQQLHGDPQVIGRRIVLDGQRHEIVGVMPASFRYPDERLRIWTPIDVDHPPASAAGQSRLTATVRLAPPASFDRVNEQAQARGAEIHRLSGGDGSQSATLMHLGRLYDERTERSLLVLGGAVAFLLLIVCANVANLTLSRSLARRRDLAVRTALGATRSDLTRESLVEYVLLGLAGAAGGFVVARLALGAVTSVLPATMTEESLNVIDLDLRTMAFLGAATLLTVLVCGVPAAWTSSRTAVADALRNDSRTSSGSARANRVRGGLVILEVALSIVLLVGAALMTRTLLRLQAIDTGLDPNGLMTIELALPAPAFSSAAIREAFVRDAVSSIRRLDGVSAVAAGAMPFRENRVTFGELELSDRPGERTPQQLASVADVWPGYLAAAGIRLIDGRDFRDDESETVAIVSEKFAKKHWPSATAVGQRFQFGKSAWRTVVGVAADVRPMTDSSARGGTSLYYPYNQVADTATATRPTSTIAAHQTIIVRASQPGEVAAALGKAVHAVDSRAIVGRTTLVAHQLADAIARPRIVFVMLSIFAGVGLLLAGAGLYGVLSHLVAQRRREIGIRLALGATKREIGRLVMGRGMVLSAIGLTIGLAASFWLVRLMRTLLYEVEPTDPASIVIVSAVLLAAAATAAWRPAQRAMRLDPVTLLRD